MSAEVANGTSPNSGAFASLSDRWLATVVGVGLFALVAWPLVTVEVPPLQDLPNHLATATILSNPELYPEFVANGPWKTNAALFSALAHWAPRVGLTVAAKAFTALTLLVTALAIPHTILTLRSRKSMLVASVFAWPMVHNWFVCMGMLDFSLATALSATVIAGLVRRDRRPSFSNWTFVAVAALCTWYAHAFPILVVCLLVTIESAVRGVRERSLRSAVTVFVRAATPLAPAVVLVLRSLFQHVTEPKGAMHGHVDPTTFLAPWELVYNLWAEWLAAFTWRTYASFAAFGAFAFAFARGAASPRPVFFGRMAMATLVALYVFTPITATNWFHVNSRFLPFLWFGVLLRLPESLPRSVTRGLVVAAVAYSVGLGIDYGRLDGDRKKFVAAIPDVPERARLLPIILRPKGASETTRPLLHAWGYYVVAKHTTAPLVFAHSRSFPIMYREAPPDRWNHMVLERFAQGMGTADVFCGHLRESGIVVDDCERAWEAEWNEFLADAKARFDHVLLWGASPRVREIVSSHFREVTRSDDLVLFDARIGASGDDPSRRRP
ncbi:MAG: hypothetical protein U0169_22530 [Polyangiaceae bacterium]